MLCNGFTILIEIIITREANMNKLLRLTTLLLIVFFMNYNSANALIKLDPDSIKISIKYGLDNKYSTSKSLLGPNWMEGDDGIIINIFSPFIQLATKAKSQNVPGASEEDIMLVKKRLGRQLKEIETRNDIRIIVQLVGDKEDCCKNYEAYIEEVIEEDENPDKEKKKTKGFWIFKFNKDRKPTKITPDREVRQDKAEMDRYNPYHPYYGTNSYNFNFNRVNKLDKFVFILKGPKDKKVIFPIEKNVIF